MTTVRGGARATRSGLALTMALLAIAPSALADVVPDTPPPTVPSPPTALDAPTVPTVPSPPSATEERYHEAFARLARGDRQGAIARLQQLVDAAPQHPLAARARALLQQLGPASSGSASSVPAGVRPVADATADGEPRTGAARAELTLFQTVHGGILGAEVCVMADCENARPWVLSLMLGAGLGFGVSFGLSDGGVRPGLARALSDGTVFGAANGVWLVLLAEDGDAPASTIAAYLALGQLAGLGIGGLLYDQLMPTTGQVSLAASGGLWLPVASAELAGALGGEFDAQGWGALMLVATNGGLAAGAWLASEVPTTASRAVLIDGGGVLGTLSGLGLGVLLQDDEPDSEATLAAGFAGTVGGLALAYVLTQSWDAPSASDAASLHVSAMPRADGGFSAQIGGTW